MVLYLRQVCTYSIAGSSEVSYDESQGCSEESSRMKQVTSKTLLGVMRILGLKLMFFDPGCSSESLSFR
jgi:hypothetical protein